MFYMLLYRFLRNSSQSMYAPGRLGRFGRFCVLYRLEAAGSGEAGVRLELDGHPSSLGWASILRETGRQILHLSPANIGKFRILVLSLYIVETIMVRIL